jgi:hypothetical protein
VLYKDPLPNTESGLPTDSTFLPDSATFGPGREAAHMYYLDDHRCNSQNAAQALPGRAELRTRVTEWHLDVDHPRRNPELFVCVVQHFWVTDQAVRCTPSGSLSGCTSNSDLHASCCSRVVGRTGWIRLCELVLIYYKRLDMENCTLLLPDLLIKPNLRLRPPSGPLCRCEHHISSMTVESDTSEGTASESYITTRRPPGSCGMPARALFRACSCSCMPCRCHSLRTHESTPLCH